jgi:hypothetical protein
MSNQSKFDPQAPSGRIAHDDRGNAVWEWRTETGNFKSDIDTRKGRALQDATDVRLNASTALPPGHSRESHNPYSSVDAPPAEPKAPRRTLDDMRKLSEEIKRARDLKKA